MKEKLMDSILSLSLSDEKLIPFLFKVCNFEDFEFVGDRVEKNGFVFKAETLYKIKTEISNNFYNSTVWKRIIEKFSAEKQEKLIELAKPVIESKNFVEIVNLYSSPDFLYFADDKIKIQLIDSMSSMNNVPRSKLNDFLFNTCSVEEFNFISKRMAETGCNWDFYAINSIKNDARKSSKGYTTTYWDSILKNYRVLRENKASEAIKKVKGSNSIKEMIEITKSGDFAFASFDVRKELALYITNSAIASGTVDERISVFATGNAKYTPQSLRQKLFLTIIEDPNIEDNQLRDFLLYCKGEECKLVFAKMVEKKVFLPKNYVARLIEIDLFRYIDKESVTKLFQDNPIGKRQLVVQAREYLQFKNYYKLATFTRYFGDILKIPSDSDLYKDVESIKTLSGRPPFMPNQKITESRIIEHKDTPVVKARILEHLNKVLAEYDEEIKNAPSAN